MQFAHVPRLFIYLSVNLYLSILSAADLAAYPNVKTYDCTLLWGLLTWVEGNDLAALQLSLQKISEEAAVIISQIFRSKCGHGLG